MYIKKLTIDNVRCFEHLEIDFGRGDNFKKWGIILGENGVGKSTVLRCLAMGLCDETSASALLRELYGEWVREQSTNDTATITLEIFSGPYSEKTEKIITEVHRTPSGYTQVVKKYEGDGEADKVWDNIFICGYGASRMGFSTISYSEYAAIDAVYTLFNYDSYLQNPELVLRRLASEGIADKQEVLNWVDKLLKLSPKSTKLNLSGLTVDGPWGKFMPVGALGDGYVSIISMLCDILGWAMFYDKSMFKKPNLKGIVLIDEIEQHLHPSWQRELVLILTELFPGIQFISTTHTPLTVLSTTTELLKNQCELTVLVQEEDSVESKTNLSPPYGSNVNQILTSLFFGLDTAMDNQIKERLQKYSKLLEKIRMTKEDKKELRNLEKWLNDKLGEKETDLEETVHTAVMKVLNSTPSLKKYPTKVLSLESKRQLKKILGLD